MRVTTIAFALVSVALSFSLCAQTAGDEEALSLLEEAVAYSNQAKTSTGSERSANIRKAATAASLACNFADSEALKAQACDVAKKYDSIVTFD